MTDRELIAAREKAIATMTECAQQLRRAQETVRCAAEVLRRAIRAAEAAERELGESARRLDRMELASTKAGASRRPPLHLAGDLSA
jgi:hypothetical protein